MKDGIEILKKIPDTGHREPAPTVNTEEFKKVIESRRSVRVFTERPIPDEIVQQCLDWALMAPNSSNLQPWEFHWVKSPQILDKAKKICLNQTAPRTAPVIIVAVARMDTWDINRKQMLELLKQSEVGASKGAQAYYNKVAKLAYDLGPLGLFGPLKKLFCLFQRLQGKITPQPATSYSELKVWAHKSTALACENLMLAFRAHGFDTCPMEGLDPQAMKKLLNLSRGSEVCMAISAGERAENGIYSERIRFDQSQFVKIH